MSLSRFATARYAYGYLRTIPRGNLVIFGDVSELDGFNGQYENMTTGAETETHLVIPQFMLAGTSL